VEYKLQKSVKKTQRNYSRAMKLALKATTAVFAVNMDSLERVYRNGWQNWLQYNGKTADT
jgi:hypothetical protein